MSTSTNQILAAMSALPRSSATSAAEKGVEEKENGPELKYQYKPGGPGMDNLLQNCLNPGSPKHTPMD